MDELYSIGENIDLATIAVKTGTNRDFQVELLLLCVKGLRTLAEAQERRLHDLEEMALWVRPNGDRMHG